MMSRIFFAICAVVMMASNAIAVCPTSATDDPQYKFVLDWSGATTTGSCAWLSTKNAATRIAKYCPRSGIKYACAATCGNTDCSCTDEPLAGASPWTFTLTNTSNKVPCWWLDWKGANNPKTAFRRGKYCTNPGVASKIDQYCGSGCGWCADTQPDWMDNTDVTGWNTPSATP